MILLLPAAGSARNPGYRIDCRSITDYPRDPLLKVLLAAMSGRWIEREHAVRAAARYLGFSHTVSRIVEAFQLAIGGAIRRGLVERDGRLGEEGEVDSVCTIQHRCSWKD